MNRQDDPFLKAFRGGFSGVLRWPQLDEFWTKLKERANLGWYVYAVGETPPAAPVSKEKLHQFITEIDRLLRKEHQEDFCGIVYVDSLQVPNFVKIYDPGNLGAVCGYSNQPPLPGWILSTLQPINLPQAITPAGNRQRWWRRLFGG